MPFDQSILTTEADVLNAGRWSTIPYTFLTECVYTKDEVKAGADSSEVVRLLPKKRHIEIFVQLWQTRHLLATAKSRRMQFSWTACGLESWLCNFTVEAHVAVIAQGQTESEKFLSRHEWIQTHLPPKCPRSDIRIWRGKEGNPNKILFTDTGSTIEAMSSDPESIRGEGKTLIRCEELQSWQWPEQAWAAIIPVVQGGGRIVVIGTPKANTFYQRLVMDTFFVQQGR